MNKFDVTTKKYKKEKVGYTMIHRWIRGRKGRPIKCEHCGKKNKIEGRSLIEWATKSGKYLRNLKDWIALCRSCHMAFDKIDRSHIQKKLWKNPVYRAMMIQAHKSCKCKHHQIKTI